MKIKIHFSFFAAVPCYSRAAEIYEKKKTFFLFTWKCENFHRFRSVPLPLLTRFQWGNRVNRTFAEVKVKLNNCLCAGYAKYIFSELNHSWMFRRSQWLTFPRRLPRLVPMPSPELCPFASRVSSDSGIHSVRVGYFHRTSSTDSSSLSAASSGTSHFHHVADQFVSCYFYNDRPLPTHQSSRKCDSPDHFSHPRRQFFYSSRDCADSSSNSFSACSLMAVVAVHFVCQIQPPIEFGATSADWNLFVVSEPACGFAARLPAGTSFVHGTRPWLTLADFLPGPVGSASLAVVSVESFFELAHPQTAHAAFFRHYVTAVEDCVKNWRVLAVFCFLAGVSMHIVVAVVAVDCFQKEFN